MRDSVLKYAEYTFVLVDRSQEDPMYYSSKLFYMVDSDVLVELRFDFQGEGSAHGGIVDQGGPSREFGTNFIWLLWTSPCSTQAMGGTVYLGQATTVIKLD